MLEFVGAHPEDEGRHAPGSDELWGESWYLDFVDPATGLAGYVRLGLYPNLGRAWYWACVVGPGRPLVTVIDHDVPLPLPGRHEIRTEGLWADYTVETALDHVSVGLEAFAVGVDDPADVYGELRGERVPLGFDLEWETDGATYAYPVTDRYEVPCRVHGEVLVGRERIELDGYGQRDHSWGPRDWWTYGWSWTAGRLDDGTTFHGLEVAVNGAQLYTTGYLQRPDAAPAAIASATTDVVLGAEGLPTAATWDLDGQALTLEPVAFSPVRLDAPDGRVSRFPRAWCRVTTPQGLTGHCWTEWNQPQG